MEIPDDLNEINAYIVMQAQREICVQILFALAAYENITKKGEGDAITTFSSIHSFLTHSANISKFLWSPAKATTGTIRAEVGKDLAEAISIPDSPLLKDKSFRDDLDHYDERLIRWIKEEYPKHKDEDPDRRSVSDLTIGDKSQKGGPNALHLRNYNPESKIYTYGDRDLNLEELKKELLTLQEFLGCVTVSRVE